MKSIANKAEPTPYAEGRAAYWSDNAVSREDNPYARGTSEHEDWERGYDDEYNADN